MPGYSKYARKKRRQRKIAVTSVSLILAVLILFGAGYYFFVYKDNPISPDIPGVSKNTDKSSEAGAIVSADKGYSISTSNILATEVGAQILDNGGNAVDAAVAVAYTLGVVELNASGIGGGGVMLIYDPESDSYYHIDYRETGAVNSGSPACVPGFVKGMQTANEKFGTMSMEELIEPARKYAADGFTVSETLGGYMAQRGDALSAYSQFVGRNGDIVGEGETLVQTELAATLKQLQEEGSDSFYTGALAEKIADTSYFTKEELADYSVILRDPPIGKFLDYEVASSPAPASGVTLIQMLKMAEMTDIENPDKDLAGYLNTLSLIANAAYADRVNKISDPTNRNIDEQNLISDEYVKELLANAGGEFEDDPDSMSTTHFSIIDKNGMVVSCTQTLRSFFGCRKMTCGFFLNNGMSYYGKGANSYEAGKRARNFCCPTIIRGDDGYVMAIGTPGGNYIPKILAPIIIDCLKFGTDPTVAVEKGRIIIKNSKSIWLEESDDVRKNKDVFNRMPYSQIWMEHGGVFGSVQIVGYDPKTGKNFAAADTRREGDAETS